MKFKNLTATVAMVTLLCGAMAAHAQTMSGKGIDTSANNSYGAQLQLDEVKAQQVVNTAAIATQTEQLEDVSGRLDGIDGRLDQMAEQINDLSKSMKTIQKTLTQATTETAKPLDVPVCDGEGSMLQSDGNKITCVEKKGQAWVGVDVNKTQRFETACEYRFYLDKDYLPSIGGLAGWYYAQSVSEDGSNIIYISHNGVISHIKAGSKTQYRVNNRPNGMKISAMQKRC